MHRAAVAIATIFFATFAAAENWPRFRGPNGTGMAGGSYSAPLSEKDIAWKIALPGSGHSSPIVWENHLYITSADQQSSRRYILCINPADGATLWKHDYEFFSYHKHKDNSYASATPAADELGVYVAWTMPNEYALLAFDHDGKERWKQSLGTFQSQHGSGSSPVVVNDLVILNDDQEKSPSALYAFDRVTGKQKWKLDRRSTGKAAMSTPCLWQPPSGPQQLIVTTWGGSMQGIDPIVGKLLWDAPGIFFSRPVGSPVTTSDIIIGVNGAGTAQRELIAVRAPANSGEKSKVLYKISKLGPHVPTPLVKGDHLYLWNDLGMLTCVNVVSGEVVWSQKVAGNYYASPICLGDVLWSISRDGDLVGINIADGYKPLCRVSLGEGSQATPAIANGQMFVRTSGHLICFKLR